MSLDYHWKRSYYGKLQGETKLLYNRPFNRSQLHFADLDGDGDSDLYIGKEDGRIAFFLNQNNEFTLQVEDFEAFHEEIVNKKKVRVSKVIDVGMNASPVFIDIDQDGDLDLFIGSGDGTIFYYQNQGNALLPILELITPIYMGLNVGRNSVPRFADVNADRAPDLLLGAHDGKLRVFFNQGSPTRALFCPDMTKQAMQHADCQKSQFSLLGEITPEIDVTPAWVDWDQDGDLDILAGKSSGYLNFYVNRGNSLEPKWELESERFLYINTGGFAAPVFFDFNGDFFPELMIGTATSRVIYYENRELIFAGLKNIPQLALDQLNQLEAPEKILKSACEQLANGDVAVCLQAMLPAYGLQPAEANSLEALAWQVLRPSSSFQSTLFERELPEFPETIAEEQADLVAAQANVNVPLPANSPAVTPVANVPADTSIPTNEVAAPRDQEVISRNNLWIQSENFLDVEKLIHTDHNIMITSGDWDQDGDVDLLLGGRSGNLYAYENRGDLQEPDWYLVEFPALSVQQRKYSAPVLADIDQDQDLDILVGKHSGELELILNQGDAKTPDWVLTDIQLGGIDVGGHSTPLVYDIDQDQDLDLLVGNQKGLIIYYENNGSIEKADFVLKSTRFGQLKSPGGYAYPSLFFWNEDSYPDLLLGNQNGSVQLATHHPLPNYPVTFGWKLENIDMAEMATSGHSAPHFLEINGDKQTDLLIGDQEGNLLVWLNQGRKIMEPEPEPAITTNSLERTVFESGATDLLVETEYLSEVVLQDQPVEPIYVLVTENYANLQQTNLNLRRSIPAFADLDGDQDLDMLIGSREGRLLQYRNDSNSNNSVWLLEDEQFLGYKGGINPAPVFADLDSDGDIDLLIGNEKGSIHYWENRGTSAFPEFFPNPTPLVGVTGGRNSIPAVADLNGDGLMDILVGNFQGHLRQYLQFRTENSFRFRLFHRRYLNLDVGLGAAPVFVDLNKDKQLDLIVASDQGRLTSFQPATAENTSPWGWVLQQSSYFQHIQMPLGSFPVFADIDQDHDLDLFIGSDAGNLYFYRNDGVIQ